jgi:hypothetical protein
VAGFLQAETARIPKLHHYQSNFPRDIRLIFVYSQLSIGAEGILVPGADFGFWEESSQHSAVSIPPDWRGLP